MSKQIFTVTNLLEMHFLHGLYSNLIRQRLLENNSLSSAFDQARSLESAQKYSEQYQSAIPYVDTVPATNESEDTLFSISINSLCYLW